MKEKMEIEANDKDENKCKVFKQYLIHWLNKDEEKTQMKNDDLVS